MIENFIAYNPTRLHFGKQVVMDLGSAASKLGKHALLVYGGGSVLRNGSYKDVRHSLEKYNINITEYSGIKPNPLVDDAREAAKLGRDNNVDMVVAVGGGSVIDSAKIIAICIAEDCDAWEVMNRNHAPEKSSPLIAVLTLAATGTEMNGTAVLQNTDTREKIGFKHEVMYPVHSFLDPGYTLSVPRDYTSYGIVDLIAHCLEAWFGYGDASLSDRFIVSIINEAREYGPLLLKELDNYELRARIMWAATNALNNLTLYGKTSGDWGVHVLGHTLSFLYDTPHGATLSIIYPAWLRAMSERAGQRISKLGNDLFNTPSIDDTIASVSELFSSLGSPVTCEEAGIGRSKREEILELMNSNQNQGMNYKLSDQERQEILSYAL